MKIVIKKHDRLTDYARILFGDILDTAFVYSGNHDNPHIDENLDEEMTEVYTVLHPESCVVEMDTAIMLRFTNGKEVFFASEDMLSMFNRNDSELIELK